MGWLRKRFGEKSTAKGVAMVTAIASIALGPEAAQEAGLIVAGLMGMWETFRSE